MKKGTLPVKIEGRRCVLRRYHPKMAAEIFAGVDGNRAHLGRFLLWVEATKSPRDTLTYIRYTLGESKAGRSFTYSVYNRKSGLFMGVISAFAISWADARCEVGYWLAADFEGQGYISDALQALEAACFKKGFNRIEIRCDAGNKKSAAVPKRHGYKLEGRLRQNMRVGDRYRDTLVFGKINAKSSHASGRAG